MKCGYNNCKFNGNVEKDIAIKFKKRYYHKECYNKKTKKRQIYEVLKNQKFASKTINFALKQMVDDDNMDVDFLLFVTNYVIDNKEELNNPFGIKYYSQNYKIIDKYKKKKRMQILKELNDKKRDIEFAEDTDFEHTKITPKYLKIDR